MKINFRKIASVIASTVMLSSTVALAAAANYPDPFVKSGVADVAVVYGASAAQTDLLAATEITTSLSSKLATSSTGTSTISGGDFVKLERTTDKFNIGNELDDFYSTLDDQELSTVLKSGTYENDNNDEFDFEQSITVYGSGLALKHFADSSLDDNEKPVIGFDFNDGDRLLNYTLTFTDYAEAGGAWVAGNDLETTTLTLLGREYYVSTARNSTGSTRALTLLDTANSAVITEGETTNIVVGGTSYDVKITFIDATNVILDINGIKTNKIAEGGVFKVADNLYVGVKDNLYNSKDSGISQVDVSLGSGKIYLENGQEVEINNVDVSVDSDYTLTSWITSSVNDIKTITLEWNFDDDNWLTTGRDLVFPGFETIKFTYGGFKVASDEVTKLYPNGDSAIELQVPVKDGTAKFDILYLNTTNDGIEGIGEKSNHLLVTDESTGPSLLLKENQSSYFVATWISSDDAESYVFEIQSIEEDTTGKNKTNLKNLADGSTLTFSEVGDIKDVGSLQMTLSNAHEDDKWANITLSASSGTTYADRIVTNDGLMIKLPTQNKTTAGEGDIDLVLDPTFWAINMTEETKDGTIQGGVSVNWTIAVDGDDGLEPTTVAYGKGMSMIETEDGSKQYEGYMNNSDLATKFWQDKPTSGLNKLEVTYHDTEAYAEVFVSEAGAALTTTGGTKILPIMDSESTTAKNKVIVGGSCINSAAAALLGSNYCGAEFTTKTGVGTGQFLIQTYLLGTDGVATLVAGYDAGDTTNAAKYFTTQAVDTTVGKKYIGTTATSATLQVA